jgi:translation initiation factor IF-3
MAKKQITHRINKQIHTDEVRIVGGIDEVENKIYSITEALDLAYKYNVDLVEKSNSKGMPICELIDYNKFLYQLKKRQKEQKNKQKNNSNEIKELRFTPNTDEHDIEFKLRHAINFLEKGYKIKAVVFFKGRQIQFKELGEALLLKFAEKLFEYGLPEQMPILNGKYMSMTIKPKK